MRSLGTSPDQAVENALDKPRISRWAAIGSCVDGLWSAFEMRVVSQFEIHRNIRSAISTRTRTAPGSRKKPTIQPTMAMGHDGVAGSRVAVQKTSADAIAEQAPITTDSRSLKAASGNPTSKPIANRPNDQPPPKRIALSNPFMLPSVAPVARGNRLFSTI